MEHFNLLMDLVSRKVRIFFNSERILNEIGPLQSWSFCVSLNMKAYQKLCKIRLANIFARFSTLECRISALQLLKG